MLGCDEGEVHLVQVPASPQSGGVAQTLLAQTCTRVAHYLPGSGFANATPARGLGARWPVGQWRGGERPPLGAQCSGLTNGPHVMRHLRFNAFFFPLKLQRAHSIHWLSQKY